MRVLLVAHGHPELTRGGAETAAHELFRALRNIPDIRPMFVGRVLEHYNGKRFQACSNLGDDLLLWTEPGDMFTFSHPAPELHRDFAALLRMVDPDVVHFHHYINLGVELLEVCKKVCPRARVVLTLHEFFAICHNNGQMVKRLGRGLCTKASPEFCARCFPEHSPAEFANREAFIKANFRFVDLFVAPSRFLYERYLAWGLDPGKMVVIENGTGLRPRRDPDENRRPRRLFGFFGQVTPYKGLAQLARAFALIAQDKRLAGCGATLSIHAANFELNPVGYRRGVTTALQQAASGVQFHGAYARDELPDLMQAVDWVIVPSVWWENSPLVIEEALACRRPVLCSDIGGMAEKIRHGQDGFHFRVGDHVHLAELIAALCSDDEIWNRLQQTMRLGRRIGDVAREHLQVYSAKKEMSPRHWAGQ